MATVTPAQARMIESVQTSFVETRAERYSDKHYWMQDETRLPAATGRVLDGLLRAGVITLTNVNVPVVGMNVPRSARRAVIRSPR